MKITVYIKHDINKLATLITQFQIVNKQSTTRKKLFVVSISNSQNSAKNLHLCIFLIVPKLE